LIVASTRKKFGRSIFGKIVPEALPSDADAEAMSNHHMTMLGNRYEMLDGVDHRTAYPTPTEENSPLTVFFLSNTKLYCSCA